MQINPINNNNPNFKAFFEIHGTENAKKMLPKDSVENLSKKLEKIGKSTDYLAIGLTEGAKPEIMHTDDSFEKSRYTYTKIISAYHFDELDDKIYTGHLATVYGDSESRSTKVYKIIEGFINIIASALEK